MILFSSIHIIDTERNITRKVRESCYKKYRLHLCSGNIGFTTCTTATLITIAHDLYRLSIKIYLKWNTTCFFQIISNYYY